MKLIRMKRSRSPERSRRVMVPAICLLLLATDSPGQSLDIFDSARISPRSTGMGTVSGPVADDASALYLNPAGLVLARGIILYGEYGGGGEEGSDRARGILVYPLGRLALGGGYFRRNGQQDLTGESIALGAAFRILEGAQGSFLSAGINLRVDRISRMDEDGCIPCGTSGESDNAFSMDMGAMLRPLPMISISYVVTDLPEPRLTTDYGAYRPSRQQRWGLAWIWENRLMAGWQHVSAETGGGDSFGFSFRTDSPLELMAGYTSDKVTGGIRWLQSRFDGTLSFIPLEEGDIYTSVSVQIYFRRRPDDIVQ
ncbi:MAG TPA: hypothetical protein VLA34_15380 [Candidatus Krumholzibacterium sp.]|nr:hypothetical protein [Candidatus Krumholzibacterium sp.]